MECEVTSAALLDAEPYDVVVPYTTSELDDLSVVQVTVALVVVAEAEIEEMAGGLVAVVNVWSVEVA